MSKPKPSGHTSHRVDHLASKLMRSPKPEIRTIAAAALSDTNMPAHTRDRVASVAASILQTGNKQERTVAASVLADHKTKQK
jgi:hypothetical protein